MEQTTALTLPSEEQFKSDLVAINKFQQTCQKLMLKGHDYGVIPGTQKPTLLKPGAEKITKILGLSDAYEVTQRTEEWDRGFFHYEVKCTLTHLHSGVLISEGLGSCNSMESKYRYRWVFPDDVPEELDKTKLVKKTGRRKDGRGTYIQYRLDNEDIYSQVNTLLKMAEKRSLIDAALHAGRLSDLFTQDIEDMNIGDLEKGEQKEGSAGKLDTSPKSEGSEKHWCGEHNCAFEQRIGQGGIPFYSHKLPGGKWCNEKKKETQPEVEAPEIVDARPIGKAAILEPLLEGQAPIAKEELFPSESTEEMVGFIDMDWLKESLTAIQVKVESWSESNLLAWMESYYNVEAVTVLECVALLDKGKAANFTKAVQVQLDKL